VYPGDVDKFARENNYEAASPLTNMQEYKDRVLRAEIPYIPVALSDNFPKPKNMKKLFEEAKSFRDHFVPHRSGGGSVGWESLTLYGLSSTHIAAHHKYGEDNFSEKNDWTDMARYCPKIVKYIKKLNYKELSRVRIMKLRGGGYIVPHTDRSKYVGGALNIALNNPPECKFYVEGKGYLPFDKSFAIYPNTGYVHSVLNNTKEDRYHIIVHGNQCVNLVKSQEESLEICLSNIS
jgi:hypothetical protein